MTWVPRHHTGSHVVVKVYGLYESHHIRVGEAFPEQTCVKLVLLLSFVSFFCLCKRVLSLGFQNVSL